MPCIDEDKSEAIRPPYPLLDLTQGQFLKQTNLQWLSDYGCGNLGEELEYSN